MFAFPDKLNLPSTKPLEFFTNVSPKTATENLYIIVSLGEKLRESRPRIATLRAAM